jgi:hypothetical protein
MIHFIYNDGSLSIIVAILSVSSCKAVELFNTNIYQYNIVHWSDTIITKT